MANAASRSTNTVNEGAQDAQGGGGVQGGGEAQHDEDGEDAQRAGDAN